ncbi:kinesin light chain 1b isoform X3 [Tachysurus ichikawai]
MHVNMYAVSLQTTICPQAYSIKVEDSVDTKDGSGALSRGTSLGRIRDVLRRSSEMLVKKLQGNGPPEQRATSNMKRAASLNYLNRTNDDSLQIPGIRRLAQSRGLSSSNLDLYSGN